MKIRQGHLSEKDIEELWSAVDPLFPLLETLCKMLLKAGLMSDSPINQLRDGLCILEKQYHSHECANCVDNERAIEKIKDYIAFTRRH